MNTVVYKAPPELKAKIRATLGKESKPRFGCLSQFSLRLAYSAAVLVLSFGLTRTWRTFSHDNDQELIAQAIGNHARSLIAVHLLDVTSSDQKAVQPWFIGKLDYSPPVVDLAQAGYPLIGSIRLAGVGSKNRPECSIRSRLPILWLEQGRLKLLVHFGNELYRPGGVRGSGTGAHKSVNVYSWSIKDVPRAVIEKVSLAAEE